MNRPIDKAVLLAAGRGTRMRDLTNELPKPMIVVRGKPILQHIIEGLRAAGVTQFLLIVGYRAEVVRQTFRDGALFGVSINYATQVAGMAREGGRTGTRFCRRRSLCPELRRYHRRSDNYPRLTTLEEDTAAIISVKRHEDVSKGGAVFVNERFELIDLRENRSRASRPVLHNAGIYAFRPVIFDFTARLQRSPRGEYELTDAIRDLARSGKKVQALELSGDWADVRDPEILAQLNR
jgi:dTDP-glucose pyrophosphorylase